MLTRDDLHAAQEFYAARPSAPNRSWALRIVGSHSVALDEIDRLQKIINDLWACPTVRADHDAMHAGEELTADAAEYRDALAALKAAAKEPING